MTDFIEVIDGVIKPELCEQFIRQFEQSGHQGPGRTGGGVDPSKKHSTDVAVSGNPEFNSLLQQLVPLITNQLLAYFEKYHFAVLGPFGLTVPDPKTGQPVTLTQDNFDTLGRPQLPNLVPYLFQIGELHAQRYTAGEGGYPYWHSEVYPAKGRIDTLHRALLFMFYLNDVQEGGETEFYYQQRSVKPKAGRMVIAPAYFTHTHRGNITVSNDKYILTSWVLFNTADRIYPG